MGQTCSANWSRSHRRMTLGPMVSITLDDGVQPDSPTNFSRSGSTSGFRSWSWSGDRRGSNTSSKSAERPSSCCQNFERYNLSDLLQLRKDWKYIENKQTLFVNIFQDIIKIEPSLKVAMGIDDDDVERGKPVEVHAAQVQRFFAKIMEKGSFEEIFDISHSLGVQHANYPIQLTAVYWLTFKKCLLRHLTRKSANGHLWNRFIADIIKELRLGFNEAILNRYTDENLLQVKFV